jgi:hypothetical protein
VFLAAAADSLAPEVYEQVFGQRGESALIHRVIVRARAAGLSPTSPPAAFGAFMRALFGPFRPKGRRTPTMG